MWGRVSSCRQVEPVSKALEITVEEQDGPDPLVVLVGELDAYSALDVEAAVAACSSPPRLDLSEVTFCDSSGLRVLIDSLRQGTRIDLTRASVPVQRVVDLTGVHELFDGT